MFYFVHDITDPENESKFEVELDDAPSPGDPLPLGSMVYEVVRVERAVIEVVRRVGPGQTSS